MGIPSRRVTAATASPRPDLALEPCRLLSTREKNQRTLRFTFRTARAWMSPGPTATRATTNLLICARNAPAPPATTRARRRRRSARQPRRSYHLPRCLCSSPSRAPRPPHRWATTPFRSALPMATLPASTATTISATSAPAPNAPKPSALLRARAFLAIRQDDQLDLVPQKCEHFNLQFH